MDPKNPESDDWSPADIAAMLTGRDDARQRASSYADNSVEFAPGFQHDEGEYVIDPDYADILSLDYDDLVRRKVDLPRR